RNTTASTNSAPEAPADLSSVVSNDTVILTWSAPLDDHTRAAGLTYNLRVGTAPGGSDIVSAPALTNGTLLLPQMGSARNRSAWLHQLTPGQTYYWSVQAVDSAFAGSVFAPEQSFSTSPLLLNPLRRPDGVFEFNFTAVPGARFNVLAMTDLTLTLSNWVVLGTATEISAGQYRFADPQASNTSYRFYRVRSP